jgi:cysteine desulfurase/selenocysteine lyase
MSGSEPPKRLYLDNAATSFPKPPCVMEAMARYAEQLGASPGRGAYAEVIETARLMTQCRERLNSLINGENPNHVVFTLNTTDALNMAIKGIALHHMRRNEPVHMITTWMDHNSILRPYNGMRLEGVEQTRLECDPETGLVDPANVEKAIRPDTKLVATIHGSNVIGTLQPIGELGTLCRKYDVPLLVDAAQTMGHVPIDVQAMDLDLVAFPGHKGLLGPLGTGGLYLRPGIEKLIDPIREGGTGSVSERDEQPDFMPDKYEPGSHNAIGIIGLGAAVGWILERGVASLWAHEQELIETMIDAIKDAPGLRLLGPKDVEHRCGVFSFVCDAMSPAELAVALESEFGVLTRAGVHCAPLAHRTMGSETNGGATRMSFGPFVTKDDVRYAASALRQCCATQMEPAKA